MSNVKVKVTTPDGQLVASWQTGEFACKECDKIVQRVRTCDDPECLYEDGEHGHCINCENPIKLDSLRD